MRRFETIKATSQRGGVDTATMYDSAADDRFSAYPHLGVMQTQAAVYRVAGFPVIDAYATNGGRDEAILFDSSADDQFTGKPEYSEMRGANYQNRAFDFEVTSAMAVAGGNDRSVQYGSIGTDTFASLPGIAIMETADSRRNVARGFEQVEAFGAEGDKAVIHEVRQADVFVASGRQASVRGGNRDDTVHAFSAVIAKAAAGETASGDIQLVEFLFTQLGEWL